MIAFEAQLADFGDLENAITGRIAALTQRGTCVRVEGCRTENAGATPDAPRSKASGDEAYFLDSVAPEHGNDCATARGKTVDRT